MEEMNQRDQMSSDSNSIESDSDSIGEFCLPLDLIIQILLYLPVISLLRFKSVCKYWNSLIQSSDFINRHHNHQNSSDLMFMRRTLDSLDFYSVSSNELDVSVELETPDFRKESFMSVGMISCNGIICVHTCDECWLNVDETVFLADIFLWNPAMRQLRDLPQPSFPPPRADYDKYHCPEMFVGFGFDVNTNGYKLVRVFFFSEYESLSSDGNVVYSSSRVEIYSINTDNWRSISAILPRDITWVGIDAALSFLNGTYCCWYGRRGHNYDFCDHCIVSFDFRTECFDTIPLPDAESVKSDINPTIALIRDKLACINKVDQSMETWNFEIWVLNEFGVKDSWTKLHRIGPFLKFQASLVLNEEFLLLQSDVDLLSYNIISQDIRNLPVELRRCFRVPYRESLVSIKRAMVQPVE